MDYCPPDDKPTIEIVISKKRDDSCQRLIEGKGHFVDLSFCVEDLFNRSPLRIGFGSNASGSVPTTTTVTSSAGTAAGTTTTTTSSNGSVGFATTTTT